MLELEGKRFYTTREVAEVLGKTNEIVRKWCRDGYLECRKIGRDYFIEETELELLKKYLSRETVLRRNWKEVR